MFIRNVCTYLYCLKFADFGNTNRRLAQHLNTCIPSISELEEFLMKSDGLVWFVFYFIQSISSKRLWQKIDQQMMANFQLEVGWDCVELKTIQTNKQLLIKTFSSYSTALLPM